MLFPAETANAGTTLLEQLITTAPFLKPKALEGQGGGPDSTNHPLLEVERLTKGQMLY